MNLSKAWNTKLEVASFLLSKILYKKCALVEVIWVLRMIKPSWSVDFWWNEAVKVIEDVEATEVIEATEVLKHRKSLLGTSESSRHCNSALFLCFEKKKFFGRIMNYHIEFWHLFCWRLFWPADVIFLKIGWWNTNFRISWSHWAP